MNNLPTLERQMPLRAYPEKDLNRLLLMDFMPYISKLLSLTDNKSAERLETALPFIKNECIGMGFAEIKKMFNLYASGKLEIQPISNYFDTILFGKIVNAYRAQKPKKTFKKIPPSEKTKEEINFIMLEAVDRLEKEVKQNGYIDSVCKHVYEYLYKQDKLPKHTKEFRDSYVERAKKVAKSKAMTDACASHEVHTKLKKTLEEIENINGSVKNIAKRLILEDYFKKKLVTLKA